MLNYPKELLSFSILQIICLSRVLDDMTTYQVGEVFNTPKESIINLNDWIQIAGSTTCLE